MLRTHTITNADAAKSYYQQSDYYLEVPGEWLGKGAERLGLRGIAGQEDFEKLCDGINPQTGGWLTAKVMDNRRIGWDFNFNSSKSVGIALELTGDGGILTAHREAVAYALGHIEEDMACRVRVDGKDEDRNTGNLIAMRVTHRTTRPDASDHKPDMSLHDHVVVFNATFDDVEDKAKAAQIGQIKHDAPYYEAIYHNRLAANLKDLGYGIRRKGKGFEISGVSDELVSKFSRRTAAIEKLAAELGIDSPEAKEKLGATTRLNKVDSKIHELAPYWHSRLTPEEAEQLKHLKDQPGFVSDTGHAVAYAAHHCFERQAVVETRKLYETALRFGMGSVDPAALEAEAASQGVLFRGNHCTTQAVLDQEARLIAFGREGRGCWQPLAAGRDGPLSGLSAEQQAAIRHVWQSPDQVILIRGGAGTGKTTLMRQAIAGIDAPVVVLAPSAEASRGVLRRDGFANADTVAKFLDTPEMQAKARHGVIWVDEAGLLSARQLDELFASAKTLDARVVLQGDHRQHAAIERSGTLQVLQDYAGLPLAELTEVRRQTHEGYKDAVAAIAKGDGVRGFDILQELGWVKQTPVFDHNQPLVDDYVEAMEAKQPKGKKPEILVIAPTHREGDEINAALRQRLKEKGLIGQEEHRFPSLKPLGWTAAERGDFARHAAGGEIVQFVRKSGHYQAGQRVEASAFEPGTSKPEHFAVYQPGEIALAKGDVIRITANGRDKTGKHKMNNGASYEVAGFTKAGDIQLGNGWVLGKDFGHMAHGRVVTSHASQGKTVDRVLIAMGSESRPAISAEQFYVSVSRARQSATIYSNLSPASLREAIARGDTRQSATEFMAVAKPAARPMTTHHHKATAFVKRTVETYRRLRSKIHSAMPIPSRERTTGHER